MRARAARNDDGGQRGVAGNDREHAANDGAHYGAITKLR